LLAQGRPGPGAGNPAVGRSRYTSRGGERRGPEADGLEKPRAHRSGARTHTPREIPQERLFPGAEGTGPLRARSEWFFEGARDPGAGRPRNLGPRAPGKGAPLPRDFRRARQPGAPRRDLCVAILERGGQGENPPKLHGRGRTRQGSRRREEREELAASVRRGP